MASRPVLVLSGARQTGKTSLLRDALPTFNYVSLDLPRDAEQAEHAGDSFLEAHPAPLIIDEVQYAPGLLRYLKHAVDADRDQPGQYALTGSQKFGLMQGVTESLAGRAAIVELHSLSLLELEAHVGVLESRSALLDAMWRGGYPEVHARDLEPVRYFSDYIATYLERDVRQALNVRSLRDFDRFLRLCALRTGQLLNLNSLASEVGVTVNTIKSWLSVLEASGVIHLLPPYFRNIGKRLVKAPKLYFMDTGLAASLVGLRSPTELENSALIGPFFETLVVGQVIRAYAARAVPAPIYFYRDYSGREVDLVVAVGEKMHLIECKWSETADASKGLDAVAKSVGEQNVLSGSIIHPTRGAPVRSGDWFRSNPVDFGWLVDDADKTRPPGS